MLGSTMSCKPARCIPVGTNFRNVFCCQLGHHMFLQIASTKYSAHSCPDLLEMFAKLLESLRFFLQSSMLLLLLAALFYRIFALLDDIFLVQDFVIDTVEFRIELLVLVLLGL